MADRVRAVDRRRLEHLHRRRAAARDGPHLPVVAEPLELAVAADADAAARVHDLLRLGGEQRVRVLARMPPARPPQAAVEELSLRCEPGQLLVLQDVVALIPELLR